MEMKEYFEIMNLDIGKCYDIANQARAKGFDCEDVVEIPLASNMVERVIGLVSVVAQQIKNCGVENRIYELEKNFGVQDWRVALSIALEVAQEKFCKFKDKKEAIETGIRVGIAYLTNGVVSSPLEGFTKIEIKKRNDGGDYIAMFFSGPIRSAGGTGASVSVLIGDYVRRCLEYLDYDASEEEIKRIKTEIYDYHERVTNLQYLPSESEIEFVYKNVGVQIDGDPSEEVEVSNFRGLKRIETDRLRNGPCLVIAEGICQKAAKLNKQLQKWGKEFGLGHWSFLEEFLKLQKRIKARETIVKETGEKIKPDYLYIKDLVAGRPVFTHPLAKGGFRLRYGRCRNSGFSATAISPVTMIILNNFIAIGTQLKVERPGKSTVVGVCDKIEGPIVKLKDGDVILLESEEEAKKVLKDIEEILFLGDILINYGDFLNRAHVLVPCGYNEEWYACEVEENYKDIDKGGKGETENKIKEIVERLIIDPFLRIKLSEAVKLSKVLGAPLHPRFTFHFNDISREEFLRLVEWIKKGKIEGEKLILRYDEGNEKRVLELIGVPHKLVNNEYEVVSGEWKDALILSLENLDLSKENVLEMLNKEFKFRDKSGTFIGARMGRPEKAKMRKLTGSPQVLFPVGKEGGRMRSFNEALNAGFVREQFPIYYCESCKNETVYRFCENCLKKTERMYYCRSCGLTKNKDCHNGAAGYRKKDVDIKKLIDLSMKKINLKEVPNLIKGVRGTSNRDHSVENLAKGILRAKHGIYVNKDGTTRYDMTEAPLTHFKAREIGVSVEKLKEFGYDKDIYGKEIVNEEQIVELFMQDVILPSADESLEKGAKEILFNVANFVDDELERIYGMERFYNLKKKEDLIGNYVAGLAPHISAGIVGRIIGFSKTQCFYAHPCFHSIMRRDADGDECGVMLLMDMLINFSRKYLPDHRGATQDTPLVLTSTLIPREVDDMVFDMDICSRYPLEFYEAALNYKNPWEIKIKKVGDLIGTSNEYRGYGFTHDTFDINNGARCSSYKSILTMMDKVIGQMDLAKKIRAVKEDDVARLVIERHFIRDIRGNLRKFSMQQFRCVKCNEKYRRPPMIGRCIKCDGSIIFTISEGGIIKYLEPSLSIAENYQLPSYLKQSLEITKRMIESVFGKEMEKQEGLGKWF